MLCCFSVFFCSVLCFSVLCWQGLPRSSRQLWHLPAGSGWKQGAAHLVVQRSSSAKTGCASSSFYTWPSYCACSCLEETAGRNISFIPVLSLASHLSLQARIPVVGRRPILCAPDATPNSPFHGGQKSNCCLIKPFCHDWLYPEAPRSAERAPIPCYRSRLEEPCKQMVVS